MSERDEAVIDPVKKLIGRAGIRRVATSRSQVQSILKDLYKQSLHGRSSLRAGTKQGPGPRRTTGSTTHRPFIADHETAELYAVGERGEIRYAGVSNNAHARATCLAYSL